MKIAFNISPLQTGHRVRGTGFYVEHLKNTFEKYFPNHEYLFFTSESELVGQIDIVHYPFFDPFFVTLPILKKYPTVVTVHDLTPIVFPQHFPSGIKGRLKWQAQKTLLKTMNAVITDSEASKRDIVSHAGLASEKITVVYLAAGEEFTGIENSQPLIEEVKKKYNLPEKYILYVGDATWNKNLPRLIEAMKGVNMTLVMVGKALTNDQIDPKNPWNTDLLKVQELARGNPKILRVGFLPKDELLLLYQSAIALIMPSIYEGFGLPIVEAMQMGCPVITTKESSLPEVAGNAAWYVEPYDIHSITNGINDVVTNESLRKDLIEKGFKQAEHYSWKKTAAQTLNVYEKILGTK